jgi:SAM-dependent methyltransferase
VSAIDFSAKMIAELEARAQREGLAIDVTIADATQLPFEGDAFDAVFSMFALNLVADRAAAFREIRRVVRPDGRAVVGTPASLAAEPAFARVRFILEKHLPNLAFDGELPLGNVEELRGEMTRAGFTTIEMERISRPVRYPSLAAMWEVGGRAAAPIVVARAEMGEERWAPASIAILRDLQEAFGAGPQTIELLVNIARGRK